MVKRVLLSASVPTGKTYDRWDVHMRTARPVLIRDAVLSIVREGLRAGFDFVFGSHPAISPMVLTVAREFPAHRPRIEVFYSRHFDGMVPQETLELADGTFGTCSAIDWAPPGPPPGDRDLSLGALREAMMKAGPVAAIAVGGMNGVIEEAMLFLDYHRRNRPLYAFGSTGGAARDLFDAPPAGCSRDDFCGGAVAPVPRSLLYDPVPGYAKVARTVFRAITASSSTTTP